MSGSFLQCPAKLLNRLVFLFLVFCLLPGSNSIASTSSERMLKKKRIAMIARGEVKKWSKRAWTSAYIYSSIHYTIYSNTSYNTCKYIGDIMELIYHTYSNIFSYRRGMPRLTIKAYATIEEFRSLSRKNRVPEGIGGFFNPDNGGAIYLPYAVFMNLHPSVTLFHEGAHQFVHSAVDMRVPTIYKKYFVKNENILRSTPIWLNEGLATYFETTYYTGSDLEIGRVNQSRLRHLQSMIRKSTFPNVREVLQRKYGQPFAAEHYAVAWGLIYYLRHDADSRRRKERNRQFNRYIKLVKKGFFHGDHKIGFRNLFIKNNKLVANFSVKWRVYIGKSSADEFAKIFCPNMSLEKWEKQWLKWIMKLDFRKKYGGTYLGQGKASQRIGR